MRLYDEIPPYPEGYGTPPVVVEVSDMARTIFYEWGDARRDYAWRKDFPRMLPPWPRTFMEYVMPPMKFADGYLNPDTPTRGAVLMASSKASFQNIHDALDTIGPEGADLAHVAKLIGLGGSYIVRAQYWIVYKGFERHFSWFESDIILTMLLDADGTVIPDSASANLNPMRAEGNPKVDTDRLRSGVAFYYPAFLACSLLNCKNVVVTDNHPDPKVAKNRIRRGKPPGTVFKTLAVTVPGSKTPVRLGALGTGTAKGRHIVRSHFATYGEHNKLFGRLTGTFYHPMHVRGRNKERKIIKDYAVKAEDAA